MPKLDVGMAEQKKWLRAQRESEDSYFFVVERLNGTKIGTFSLYNIKGDEAETGRLILRGNQIEALETYVLFHDFCYGKAAMQVLFAEIEEKNNAAMGAAVELGGSEYSRRFDEKTGIQIVQIRVTKKEYMEKREKLAKLVDRFAARN